jgi:hypothetical protein
MNHLKFERSHNLQSHEYARCRPHATLPINTSQRRIYTNENESPADEIGAGDPNITVCQWRKRQLDRATGAKDVRPLLEDRHSKSDFVSTMKSLIVQLRNPTAGSASSSSSTADQTATDGTSAFNSFYI